MVPYYGWPFPERCHLRRPLLPGPRTGKARSGLEHHVPAGLVQAGRAIPPKARLEAIRNVIDQLLNISEVTVSSED